MIRICFISPTFPYMNCGVGDYTQELIKSLENFDLEMGVITSQREKIKKFMQDSPNKKVALFPIIKRWDFSNMPILIKKIKHFKPDIIHIQYHWLISNDGFLLKGLMLTLFPLILKFLKIKSPIVTTLHSRLTGPFLFRKAGKLRHWALLPLLVFSDRIIVTNKFDGRTLSRWLPFLKKKIEYIMGGTGHYLRDGNLIQKARELKPQIKDSDNEIIISHFGFMIPHKGIEEILEAISILRNKGYLLRLLAIGGFDIEANIFSAYFERLKKMANDLKLESYIKWTGFCGATEASLFLLASDICVMPFRDGGSEWRSSLLDVFSHGLPVVTTYSEKTPEELITKVNCILIPPKDSVRLAMAIEELIQSPGLRKNLGEAASELYKRQYDWPIIAGKTVKTYRDQLKSRNNPN